jgi:hypothetical protein
MTTPDIEAAWNAVHHALPSGWEVGRPAYVERRNEWQLFAFRHHRPAPADPVSASGLP